MIIVYADESGTHDPLGKQSHSEYPVVAGWAARKSVWDTFWVEWSAVLRKYGAPYFHGRELVGAERAILDPDYRKRKAKQLLKNPYFIKKWDVRKMTMFRRALAKVAVKGRKIPILGAADIPAFNTVKDRLADKDPYKYCMNNFFLMFQDETGFQWGNFKSRVSFLFDQNKTEWEVAVREIFNIHQKNDPRIATLDFRDKKDPMLLPLQAADLLAHRYRQLAEDFGRTGKFPSLEPLDAILFKNLLESRGPA